MLEGYVGRPGAGKSYCMIERASKFRGKRQIYSNMNLSWATYFENWSQLIGVKNALVLLDEAGVWFNSRDSADIPREVLSFMSQQRKQGVDILYTVQRVEGIDAHIRGLTATFWYCQRYGGFIWKKGVDPHDPKKKPFAKGFVPIRKSVYSLYDTFELIGDANGQGAARGAAAIARREALLSKHLKNCWVREDLGQPEFGIYRPVFRPAIPDDFWQQKEIYHYNKTKPAGLRFEAVDLTDFQMDDAYARVSPSAATAPPALPRNQDALASEARQGAGTRALPRWKVRTA